MATVFSSRRWQLLQLVWSPILLSFLLLSVTTIPIHGYLSSRSITTTAFRQLNRRSPRLSMSSEPASKYKKVFVAGGSRGVGHAVVEKLSESGILVVALVRSEDSKTELDKIPGVSAVLGDAFDKKAIEEAMDGCDAAITTLGGTTDDRRVDYVGNNNVIESAGILGVQRIILVTSIGCGSSRAAAPPNVFEVLKDVLEAKEKAENILIDSYTDSNWSIIRPGGLVSEAMTGNAILTEDTTVIGSIHREDVADLVIKVLHSTKTERKVLSAVDSVAVEGKVIPAFEL